MLADLLGWQPRDVRHLRFQLLPVLVHAPLHRGHPGEAGFHDDEARGGIALENPFEDEAGDQGLGALRGRGMLLDVVSRPTSGSYGMPAIPASMDAHRQIVPRSS